MPLCRSVPLASAAPPKESAARDQTRISCAKAVHSSKLLYTASVSYSFKVGRRRPSSSRTASSNATTLGSGAAWRFLAHGFSAADAGRCGGGGAAEGIALAQELEEDAGRCGDGGAAEGFVLAEDREEEEDDDDADDVDFFLGLDDGPEGGRTAVSRATLSHKASLRWPVLVRASPRDTSPRQQEAPLESTRRRALPPPPGREDV